MTDADLVLEGGGVKGSSLVGAVAALANHSDPYTFHRIAGTSAGAIVAGLLASGMEVAQVKTVMDQLDFSRFEDEVGFFSHIPGVGATASLLLHEGLYAGGFLHDWLTDTLAEHGVRTWADLKEDDPDSELPPSQRYKLVVIVSDVSRGLMLRLPWDYEQLLGVDPGTASVADAIRASASIPFFFRPWKLPTDVKTTGHDHIVCVDGGMLSNFPMSIFDRHGSTPARWPTLGVKLSGRSTIRSEDWAADDNGVQLAKSLLSTMIGAHDRSYVNDPQAISRTVFVDTSAYHSTDFKLTAQDKQDLYAKGHASAERFLSTWDWERWKSGDYFL